MADKPPSPFMDLSQQLAGIITLCIAPLALAVGEISDFGRGEAAFIAFTCIAVSIRFAWPLRKERWFWFLIMVLTVAHAFAIVFLDWSWLDHLGRSSGLLAYPDFGLITGAIYLTYLTIYGRPTEPVEDDPDALPTYSQRDLDL